MALRLPTARDPKAKTPALTPDAIIAMRGRDEITPNQGLDLLDRYIREAFPEKRIQNLLTDLVEANDTKFSHGSGFYKTPNWAARREGFRDLLKLRRVLADESKAASPRQPTKVVFNVIYSEANSVAQQPQPHPGPLSSVRKPG